METIYIDPHTKESLEHDDYEQEIGRLRQEREYSRRSIIHDRCQKLQMAAFIFGVIAFPIAGAWGITKNAIFLLLASIDLSVSSILLYRLTLRMQEVEGPIE